MLTGKTTQSGSPEPAAVLRLTSDKVKRNAEMIEANGSGDQSTTRTDGQTCSRWQSKVQLLLVQLLLGCCS